MKEDDGILKRQSLKTIRVYSHGYQKRYLHMKRSKQNLFGKVVKYYNLVLNKTCITIIECNESKRGYSVENVP